MKRKYTALFLMAALAFTAVPALNPVADATVVAEAHGGHHGGHHGHRSTHQSDYQETGHYHCGGYAAHSHENGVCPYNTESRCYDNTDPCYESCDQGQGYGHC